MSLDSVLTFLFSPTVERCCTNDKNQNYSINFAFETEMRNRFRIKVYVPASYLLILN